MSTSVQACGPCHVPSCAVYTEFSHSVLKPVPKPVPGHRQAQAVGLDLGFGEGTQPLGLLEATEQRRGSGMSA